MPIRTLIAHPPDDLVAVGSDDDSSKVSICGMVPLLLQVGGQPADVWRPWLSVGALSSLTHNVPIR